MNQGQGYRHHIVCRINENAPLRRIIVGTDCPCRIHSDPVDAIVRPGENLVSSHNLPLDPTDAIWPESPTGSRETLFRRTNVRGIVGCEDARIDRRAARESHAKQFKIAVVNPSYRLPTNTHDRIVGAGSNTIPEESRCYLCCSGCKRANIRPNLHGSTIAESGSSRTKALPVKVAVALP